MVKLFSTNVDNPCRCLRHLASASECSSPAAALEHVSGARRVRAVFVLTDVLPRVHLSRDDVDAIFDCDGGALQLVADRTRAFIQGRVDLLRCAHAAARRHRALQPVELSVDIVLVVDGEHADAERLADVGAVALHAPT